VSGVTLLVLILPSDKTPNYPTIPLLIKKRLVISTWSIATPYSVSPDGLLALISISSQKLVRLTNQTNHASYP
jgi:hypothetical protein